MAQNQQSELSQLIKKLKNFELPEVDITELCSPSPSVNWTEFLPEFKGFISGTTALGAPLSDTAQNPHGSAGSSPVKNSNIFLIDVRSESEFKENAIPGAVNFPIFNDKERHNVGLLFKQQSEELAEQVGAYYAFQKKGKYISQIREAAGDKKIIVHCWRGGYRSQAVTALLNRSGMSAYRLEGGHKGFRRMVHKYLYDTPPKLISLSGETGTGKSEVLEAIIEHHPEIPVLHLEEAARHASSVFGAARFGWQEVTSQPVFETRIFIQLLPWLEDEKLPIFLTEKESSQIGKVLIPNGILTELKKEKHIRLVSTLTTRVNRLKKEYINDKKDETLVNLRHRISFLKRFISSEELEQYLALFDQNEWHTLLEKILVNYYDKVYKKCVREPIAEVSHEVTSEAMEAVIILYKKQTSLER
ncbi:MAG: tRNA 2-selenouridine(34) synthase MnmH [Lentisphaerales bacterium]|nr:tRNA 2-selenouridine(34) synthase MnmH [Lentisphaerales bacterium]